MEHKQNEKSPRESGEGTLWQKLSIFVLTGVVAISIVVCQWLFGMLYPQDSYREYTNWEIQELTADNFLTPERIAGLAKVIDRKGQKTLWLDRVNRLAFDSAGQLMGVDLEILAVDVSGQAQRFSFTITGEEPQARLIRLEGYETVDGTQDMAAFETLETLCNHPLKELANQMPIANQSQFWVIGLGDDREQLLKEGTLRGTWEQYDWLVRTKELTLSKTAEQEGAPGESVWFVRKENGWFSVTDWKQVSPQFAALDVLVYDGDSGSVSLEYYGRLLLEQ